MAESILKRARAFIGLEEEGESAKAPQQLDMGTILKGKKEGKGEGSYEIIFYEPKIYEDSLNISTHLRFGSPVIINLKYLEPAEGTRLIDFVCGTAYAIDGHMMKIGELIFLFAPSNISITNAEERATLGEKLENEEDKKETFFNR